MDGDSPVSWESAWPAAGIATYAFLTVLLAAVRWLSGFLPRGLLLGVLSPEFRYWLHGTLIPTTWNQFRERCGF